MDPTDGEPIRSKSFKKKRERNFLHKISNRLQNFTINWLGVQTKFYF